MINPRCSSYFGCRAPSIPEGHDLSRSSSNASSFASVVEENETEATEDYDTGLVSGLFMSRCDSETLSVSKAYLLLGVSSLKESLSSAGTPHKRDSFTYSPWMEDSTSSTSNTSRGSSPGEGEYLMKQFLQLAL